MKLREVVLTGTVTEIVENSAKVKVIKVYKGPDQNEFTVAFMGLMEKGYKLIRQLKLGESYLIGGTLAKKSNEIIELSLCGLRRPVSDTKSKETINWLESEEGKKGLSAGI